MMRDLKRLDYVLVVGGRSGSTWVLDLLDQSAETFCRNEPYGAAGSSLARLTSHRFFISEWNDEQQQQWDEAIQSATTHMGERDRPIQVRKCLALEVQRSITSRDVIDVLAELFIIRGVPGCIRSDNGPEFIATAIRLYLERAQVQTLYIEKGAPWENGYAESFHGRVRDELLNVELFLDLGDAKGHAGRWKNEYNHRRPHSSLGYVPPAKFAATLVCPPVGAAPLPPARPTSSCYPVQTLIAAGT